MSETTGLATMIEELVRQNLRRDPSRRRFLRPAVAELEAPDADVVVTVRVTPDGLRAVDGPDASAPIRIRADAARLFALAAAPLRFGLPDPLTAEGRAVIADLIAGRVRVRGLLRHLPEVTRLVRLFSAR